MTVPIRIKCTDSHRNVSYVHNSGGSWRCNLSTGIPASMSYAGIHGGEMAVVFALDDAQSPSDALAVMQQHGSRLCRYEVA